MLSRVADSLYWMSRNLERAEHTARLLRVVLSMVTERPQEEAGAYWARALANLGARSAKGGAELLEVARTLTFDRTTPQSIMSCIGGARDNARQVREQITSEMWQELNRRYLALAAHPSAPDSDETLIDLYTETIDAVHLFQGITDATMRHGEGWHFIQLGRFLERGQSHADLLASYFHVGPQAAPAPTNFDWINLLKMVTAFEAFCKVYTANIRPSLIAEFLIFDAEFPRSLRFSVDMVQTELHAIASNRHAGDAERIAGRLRATLDYGQLDDISVDGIHDFLTDTRNQLARIHGGLYESYIDYPADAYLAV